MAERDIKLVLITGAGATHEFGANARKVPMMAEWSNSLIDKLGEASGSYIEATGLTRNIDGPEFEKLNRSFLALNLGIPKYRQ